MTALGSRWDDSHWQGMDDERPAYPDTVRAEVPTLDGRQVLVLTDHVDQDRPGGHVFVMLRIEGGPDGTVEIPLSATAAAELSMRLGIQAGRAFSDAGIGAFGMAEIDLADQLGGAR